MKYGIFLNKADEIYKVSGIECSAEDASRQLSLYLFRHYPVSFYDDRLSEDGDSEKILKDSRNGLIVWREGDLECKLPEGVFYITENIEDAPQEEKWWKYGLPESKKMVIEGDIKSAYKKGYGEGYRQGICDLMHQVQLN
ncbi:MAG: hypothetical protein ACLQQ4_15935 [Bacteroidia bacterium]